MNLAAECDISNELKQVTFLKSLDTLRDAVLAVKVRLGSPSNETKPPYRGLIKQSAILMRLKVTGRLGAAGAEDEIMGVIMLVLFVAVVFLST